MSSNTSPLAKLDDQAGTKPAGGSPPARSGRSIVIPAVMLLLGVGGGLGAAFFFGVLPSAGAVKPAMEEAAAAAESTEAAAPRPAGSTDGAVTVNAATGNAVTNLGAFTVNLRGGAGGRVLRLEVQIETPIADAAGLTARSAQLRDSVITAVSDYTWSELEGAEGKSRLRDELISRVNGVVAPTAIGRLYFTQFVIQ